VGLKPILVVPEMTYKVLSGTLSLYSLAVFHFTKSNFSESSLVHYGIWGVIQQRVCPSQLCIISEMKCTYGVTCMVLAKASLTVQLMNGIGILKHVWHIVDALSNCHDSINIYLSM